MIYFTMIKDVLHIMFTLVRKRKEFQTLQTCIRPRMLYNCRVSFIMKYCTVFKLEIILSTESEMVWPCESRARGQAPDCDVT